MFKIATTPSYTAIVNVEIPGNNGKITRTAFTVTFKRLSQAELDKVTERLAAKELTDAGLIDEVMIGWKDVADEQGTPLEFNETNLAALLDVFPVRPAIVKAFFASNFGARAKN